VRIDEEQRQDLPMAKFGLVEQLKRFNTVLKDVRECEETAFSGDDVSRILHSRTVLFTLVDILEAVMVVLLINDVLPSLFPVSCGNLVSTGMVILFMKESFPVCSGWGEVLFDFSLSFYCKGLVNG
jgi:hypothetical protein